MKNWQDISLELYESHLDDLEITKGLNTIFKRQLKEYGPDSLTIWGIAGGLGLDQIKDLNLSQIVGIDTNRKFLDKCSQRYQKKYPKLKLKQIDLDNPKSPNWTTDFIWAPLVFSYLKDISVSLKYAAESLEENGILSVVVLDSPVEESSLPKRKPIDLKTFETVADKNNLHLIEITDVNASSEVKLKVIDFIKRSNND